MFREIKLINAFKLLHPRFTVLVTSEFEERKGVMAASWVTPVSRNPPIVAVSISPQRETFKLIVRSGFFALNILDLDFLENVNKAGIISAREVKDKFLEVKLTSVPGKVIKIPVVKEAKGILECEVWKTVEAGDHVLFLGKVVSAYVDESFEEEWNVGKFKPILHIGGTKYTTCKEEVYEA